LIYFIRNTVSKNVKIGRSDRPESRIRTFQTANHDPLEIVGSIPGGAAEEAALHRRFEDYRIQGEWFRGDSELYHAIDRILNPAPKLLGRKIESVYLAGKITGDPWREEILGPGCSRERWSVAEGDDEWFRGQIVPVPGWERMLDYRGPFWLDPADGSIPNEDAEHAYGDPWNHLSTDCNLVRSKSLNGVYFAHLVFAWIDSNDCFGTIAEISVAYSRARQSRDYPIIAIATPYGFVDHQMWFVMGMAHYRVDAAGSPAEAWDRLWTGKARLVGSPKQRGNTKDMSEFQVGDFVVHTQYGHGQIIHVRDSWKGRIGRIGFANAGEMDLVLALAPLRLA
jgi:hypothetical protein